MWHSVVRVCPLVTALQGNPMEKLAERINQFQINVLVRRAAETSVAADCHIHNPSHENAKHKVLINSCNLTVMYAFNISLLSGFFQFRLFMSV